MADPKDPNPPTPEGDEAAGPHGVDRTVRSSQPLPSDGVRKYTVEVGGGAQAHPHRPTVARPGRHPDADFLEEVKPRSNIVIPGDEQPTTLGQQRRAFLLAELAKDPPEELRLELERELADLAV